MPIKISNSLPAADTLKKERIFVMTEERAAKQDIRPLSVLILNLMPNKIVTETQILRQLSNTPLQIKVDLLYPETHTSKNTDISHLNEFYTSFSQIKNNHYDGMIITGAPVEHLEFEKVDYWEELCKIMEWTKTNVYSTLHICWGAQAGLYYHHKIPKYLLERKLSGIYPHSVLDQLEPIFRGFDDVFYVPHSRNTTIKIEEVVENNDLRLLSTSAEAGAFLVISKDGRQLFVTGHPEYDANTLNDEYKRDIAKGINVPIPVHYYPNNNPENHPIVIWRSYAQLLYTNWLNYYVYQETPFDLDKIKKK